MLIWHRRTISRNPPLNLQRKERLWREMILLATGKLVYLSGDIDKPAGIGGRTMPNERVGGRSACLAKCLAGRGGASGDRVNRVMDTNLGRDLHERVQQRLVQIIEGGKPHGTGTARRLAHPIRVGRPALRCQPMVSAQGTLAWIRSHPKRKIPHGQ